MVVIPEPKWLSDEELEIIDNADWYEEKGAAGRGENIILVSAKEINYLSETDPSEAGLDIANTELILIGQTLHRWSEEDGFYHS